MRGRLKPAVVSLVVLLTVAGVAGYVKFFRWKRFAVVEDGVLYRSGLLSERQLQAAIQKYGIKTVFSFTGSNNVGEQELCDRLGVRRYFHYLAGDGVGPDDPYLKFLQVMEDADRRPVLVHCSAGVQRTGGAVVLYRTLFQGWEFDRAIDEMIAMGNEGKAEQIEQLSRIHERLKPPAVADASNQPWNR